MSSQNAGRRPALARAAGGLLLGTAVVLGSAVLFGWVASRPAVAHLDRELLRHLAAHHDASAEALRWLTWLGDPRIVSAIAAALCVALVVRHQHLLAVTVAVAVGGGFAISVAAKAIVARERPTPAVRLDHVIGSSLPSTHATLAVVLLGMLAWLVTRHLCSVTVRVLIWSFAVLLAAAVGVSRVFLGVHWPTDVLSGWCLGIGWAVTCILVAERSLLPFRDDAGEKAERREWRGGCPRGDRRKVGTGGGSLLFGSFCPRGSIDPRHTVSL